MTQRFILVAGVLGLLSCASAASVSNGSFENPSLGVGGFAQDPTNFAPWTFTGGAGVAANGSFFHNPGTADGNQFAFLSSIGTISQIFSTIPNSTASLLFYVAKPTDSSTQESLTVAIDGNNLFSLPDATALGPGWVLESVQFTANGTGSTNITFTGGGPQFQAAFLDKVTVTPEPISFGLVALGMLISAAARLRVRGGSPWGSGAMQQNQDRQ